MNLDLSFFTSHSCHNNGQIFICDRGRPRYEDNRYKPAYNDAARFTPPQNRHALGRKVSCYDIRDK